MPSTLLPALPAIRNLNTFDTNFSTKVGSQPTTHIFDSNLNIVQNLRQAPSNLGLTVAGSISSGIFTITGTTITLISDVVYTVGTKGLEQDLSSAIKTFLKLSSSDSVSSNISIARISKFEKVTTSTNTSQDVTAVLKTYDLRGYGILDNSFVKEESIQDTSLTKTEVKLPATPDNKADEPSVGDRIRVTFHIVTSNDSENIAFSRSGIQYTNKRFALVDTIAISSGFTSGASSSATLTVTALNQPTTRSRYKVFYDYTAPKVNERITIRYNYDRLITDTTFNVEKTRPITADVLVKASIPISVDVTMNIVVTNAFKNNTEIVKQNVQDAITTALNATSLGTVIDSSDLIAAAYAVEGVDRARILFFNKTGNTGSVLSIQAQKNEYIQASEVTINIETR